MERTYEEATEHYTPEEKVGILRRHLLDEGPSRRSARTGFAATVFCRWQKEFFKNGATAFEQKARPVDLGFCRFPSARGMLKHPKEQPVTPTRSRQRL